MLTGVEPGGSVATAADRLVSGQNPDFSTLAPGAVAALTGPPAPAPAPPSPVATSLTALKTAAETERATRDTARKALDAALLKRQVGEEFQRQALKDYRAAYNEERPTQPKLAQMPAAPDVTIRPWLDPEGKSLVSVIAQTLGMLAVGAAGAYYHTPMTAMRYFREAAEDWRRDEVDAASSKLKKFEMEVGRAKSNNEVMLKKYELADKEFAHNIDAKKAMVLAAADELKLDDEATRLGQLGYEQAVAASKADFDNWSKIQTHLEKFADLEIKMRKAQATGDSVQKNPFAAAGMVEALRDKIKVEADPAKKADLQRQADQITRQLQSDQSRNLEKLQAAALINVGKVMVPKINTQIDQMDRFASDLVRFDDAVRVLGAAGVLPDTPTPIARLGTEIQNLFPSKWADPKVQQALTAVQTLGPALMVTYERVVENNIGIRVREAFNLPSKWEMLTVHQLHQIPRMFGKGAENAKLLLEDRRKQYSQGLPALVTPSGADESDQTDNED
jgi:hypothetical protein